MTAMAKQKGRALTVVSTQSELGEIRTCPWRWWLKYVLGADPVDAETSRALFVGRAMHAAIAAMWMVAKRAQEVGAKPDIRLAMALAAQAAEAVIREYAERINAKQTIFSDEEGIEESIKKTTEAINESSAAVELYAKHIYAEDVRRYEVLEVERAFRVPLPSERTMAHNVWLEGVFDLVLRDREPSRGMRRLVHIDEHKSTVEKAHLFDFRSDVDPQVHLYQYAAGYLWGDENVGPVGLNAIRKKGPRVPKTLKDGTISVAACDTTSDVYREALAMQALPDFLLKAKGAYEDSPTPKNAEKLADAKKRHDELLAKQQEFVSSLPSWDAYAKKHVIDISPQDAWRFAREATGTSRLVRLFARGQITPWRNGTVCTSPRFGACGYRQACVNDVREIDGIMLVKREHLRPEIEEATRTQPMLTEPVRLAS